MSETGSRGRGLILLSFIVALLLTVMPLPEWAQVLRPQWAALVLIYWTLMLPERVGVASGWTLGLILDVLTGTLLGQQALGMSLIAYGCLKVYQRTRIFPLWQQSLIVLALLLMERVLSLWIRGASGANPPGWEYWLSPLIGMLLWPWLYIVLRDLQQRFRAQ